MLYSFIILSTLIKGIASLGLRHCSAVSKGASAVTVSWYSFNGRSVDSSVVWWRGRFLNRKFLICCRHRGTLSWRSATLIGANDLIDSRMPSAVARLLRFEEKSLNRESRLPFSPVYVIKVSQFARSRQMKLVVSWYLLFSRDEKFSQIFSLFF